MLFVRNNRGSLTDILTLVSVTRQYLECANAVRYSRPSKDSDRPDNQFRNHDPFISSRVD